jgi:sterol 3beta-glucosyltransferase
LFYLTNVNHNSFLKPEFCKMKIAITALGSRGDLQPYIALGIGLKDAGHDVLIISAKNEAVLVRDNGLDFYALDVDIQKLMEGNDVQEMAKGNNPIKFIVSHLKGSKKMKALMVKTQAEIYEGCKDADVIVFHPGMPIGFYIAKQLGKISVLVNPFPVVSTNIYPSILFYTMPRLGKLFNIFTHAIFQKVFWAMSKPAIKEFWNATINTKMNFSVSPIQQQIESGMPVINGYSELLFSHSGKWGKNIFTSGSLLIETKKDFVPPEALVQFIENIEPPIYIGFGSMKDLDSFKETLKIIAEALAITKQRAVVALGWSNLNYDEPIPENIFLLESIPHSWLFPKMKMVVHHGGAGTTAAGLTAGKPTIIIPHNADQPAWGLRVYELGVGAKPIKKTKLTAENFSKAILYAMQPNIIANAKKLGVSMSKENGVKRAVGFINAYIY